MKIQTPLLFTLVRRCLLPVLAFAASATCGHATTYNPPQLMAYQGYLTDASGNALGSTNTGPKNYNVVFRIWDNQAGGTISGTDELYAEQQTVTVNNGYFSVLLGQGSPYATEPHTNQLSGLFTGTTPNTLYVEMTVLGIGISGANITIAPRLQLLTSAYSFLSANAVNAVNANTAVSAASLLVPNSISNPNNVPAVTVTPAGNVGIGTNNPTVPLQVAGAIAAGSLNLSSSSANPLLALQNPVTDPAGFWGFYYGQGGSNSLSLNYSNGVNSAAALTLATNGNVGIGGAFTPQSPLDVETTNFLATTIAGNSANGTWLSLGSDYSYGNYWNVIAKPGLSLNTDQLVISWGNTPTNETTDVLTLQNGGNGVGSIGGRVGINTTAPQAPLDVEGTALTQYESYFSYFQTSGTTLYLGAGNTIRQNTVAGNQYVSIFTSGNIGATVYYAFSDARIKNISGISSSATDLATLRGIQVTDFTYKDVVAKGSSPVKKVVAQQVEKVFPQAVSQGKGVIPDIYRPASVHAGWVQVSTDLKPGERVRLIGQDNVSAVYDVLSVTKDAFQVKLPETLDHVFVYGREVNDFRTVDYDAIAMLNVSATQELANRLDKLEARASQVAALEREVGDLKKLVTQLAKAAKTSKLTAQRAVDASAVTTAGLDR